jgi:hypothetical protein
MKQRFTATIGSSGESGTRAYVVVPAGVMAAFAPRKRVPVKATIDGYTYRTTIADMGGGPVIGLRKSVCQEAGVAPGDAVAVVLELDLEERSVRLPRDLQQAMTKPECAAFQSMSYTHQKEYVQAIEDAKRPETREKRLALAVAAARKRLR